MENGLPASARGEFRRNRPREAFLRPLYRLPMSALKSDNGEALRAGKRM